MKVEIKETQRGYLYRNNKLIKLLPAGIYHVYGKRQVEVVSLEEPVASEFSPLKALLQFPEIREQTTAITVKDQQIALHYVDGKFFEALPTGEYAFWNLYHTHTFRVEDVSKPEISPEIPREILLELARRNFCKVFTAKADCKTLLFLDQRLDRVLDAGVYFFWSCGVDITTAAVSTQTLTLDISGQEILTKDKVTLRLNFTVCYRITDYVRVYMDFHDHGQQLRTVVQMALREFIGKYRIDEILENREEISEALFGYLRTRESDLFVTFSDAGIKDIILPGEIRDIMNTVLVAEKRAQANVITRREEVASTRSLLNTAKLMDENQTLYKLKELEYVERICENVGTISVNGSGDLLTQLTTILQRKAE